MIPGRRTGDGEDFLSFFILSLQIDYVYSHHQHHTRRHDKAMTSPNTTGCHITTRPPKRLPPSPWRVKLPSAARAAVGGARDAPFLPIASFFPRHPPPEPSQLSFHTNFCPGSGKAWFVEGVKVFQIDSGWTDVEKQTSVGDMIWPSPRYIGMMIVKMKFQRLSLAFTWMMHGMGVILFEYPSLVLARKKPLLHIAPCGYLFSPYILYLKDLTKHKPFTN